MDFFFSATNVQMNIYLFTAGYTLIRHCATTMAYAKMQLVYHCKRENKIYLTKLLD